MKNSIENYIFPKRPTNSLLIFLGILAFAIFNLFFYIIPGFKEFSLGKWGWENIDFVYLLLVSYSLLSLLTVFSFRIFREVRTYNEGGLIKYFVKGIIWGPIAAIFGIFAAATTGMEGHSISEIVMLGYISGLILFLTIGFLFALIVGLLKEFSKV